jgi:hypothetical protein
MRSRRPHRLDALARLGLLYDTGDCHFGIKRWTGKSWSRAGDAIGYSGLATSLHDGDPYAIGLSLNVHRRHLTAEKKRELIADVLKARPHQSNRAIAEQTGTYHKMVAEVRKQKIATGEIPQLEKTVGADGKERKQPAVHKPAGAVTEFAVMPPTGTIAVMPPTGTIAVAPPTGTIAVAPPTATTKPLSTIPLIR